MARHPADQIPQRRLLNILRLETEHAMAGSKPAARRVDQLVDENPYSAFSRYVLYNLGANRSRWMASRADARADASREATLARAAALLRRSDAAEIHSFVGLVERVFRG